MALSTTQDDEENQKPATKEYIFVDFNAWEFSRSDELWVGLVRNIYRKVECRMQNRYSKNASKVDYKLLWRVEKTKRELEKRYGKTGLRIRVFLLLVLGCGIVVTILLFALIEDISVYFSAAARLWRLVLWVLGLLALSVPAIRLITETRANAGRSRGDFIFSESGNIRDTVGFMSMVKTELDELFAFLDTFRYRDEECIKFVLVLFVDDLDRCLEGRNVKVLEAIQLVINISGAPVIVFLAIDSRVLVASIEASINKSLSVHDALITGYKYYGLLFYS